LHESKGQKNAEVQGAVAQPVPALRTFAWLFTEIPAVPPLFQESGTGGRDTGSDKIELVGAIDGFRLTIAFLPDVNRKLKRVGSKL